MSAQVFNQSQEIISPYGGPGFIVSTTTGVSGKLQATTTPFFANFFFGNATGTTLALSGSSTVASILNVGGALNANGALTVTGTTKLASLSGVLKGTSGTVSAASNGTDYTLITALTCGAGQFFNAATAAGVFTCATPAGTTYTATFPIVVTGSVISSLFSTTTNSGMAAGNLYVGSNGVFQTSASSSIFGYTPVNPATTVTVAGTANQLTSSNGAAQALSGNVSTTFSLPNHVIFPVDFLVTNSSTTNATTTGSAYFTGVTASRLGYIDSTGKLTSGGTGTSGNCVQWGANNTLADAGAVCGTGGGGVTSVAATYPIITSGTSGAITLSTAFGTTTTWSIGNNGLVMTGPTGIPFSQATSSPISLNISGNSNTATALAANGTNCSAGNYPLGVDASGNAESCTTANLGTVTAVNGTANQITSSGGTTPTLSLPNHVIFPVDFLTTNSSTTNATTTGSMYLTPLATPAGTFLAADPNGRIIATTTPSGSGGVTSVGMSLPIGFTVTGSPVTTTGTLTATFGTGYGIKKSFTWIVAASGGDFTTLQGAMTACGTAGGGSILMTDSVYNDGSTALQWKGSNCQIYGASGVGTTTINFTGATTLFKSDTTAGYTHDGLHGLLILGDGNTGGVAIDWSDMTHGDVGPIEAGAVGTALKLAATTDTTFYNHFHDLDFNDNRKWCIDASSTNAVNGNSFENIFCGSPANANGIEMDNGNGNSFHDIYLEPGSTTGTIGLTLFDNKMTNNGGVWNNEFDGFYVEANTTGIKIAVSTPGANGNGIQRNQLSNFIDEANATTDWNVPASEVAVNTFINDMDSNFSDPITSFQPPFNIGTSTRLAAIGNTVYSSFALSADNTKADNEFVVANSSNRTDFTILNSGALKLGTTTAGCLNTSATGIVSALTCAGGGVTGGTNAMLTAWTGATTLTATGTPSATAYIATTTTATSTFAGSLLVGTTTETAANLPGDFMAIISNALTSFGGLLINTVTNSVHALEVIGSDGLPRFNLDDTTSTSGFAVGTTTGAVAEVDIVGLFGNVPINNAFFQIASSSQSATSTLFLINNVGHVIASSTNPVVTCTGGTLTSFKGDDTHGEGVCGTGSTVMTVTFGAVWSAAPICVISNQSMSITSALSYTVSATALTMSQAVGMAGDKMDFMCEGVTGPQ